MKWTQDLWDYQRKAYVVLIRAIPDWARLGRPEAKDRGLLRFEYYTAAGLPVYRRPGQTKRDYLGSDSFAEDRVYKKSRPQLYPKTSAFLIVSYRLNTAHVIFPPS